jgi:hypothetical protein
MARKSLWVEATAVAGEIAVTTVLFAFLGYFLGGRLGRPFDIIGLTAGAFAGFTLVIYRIVKRFG